MNKGIIFDLDGTLIDSAPDLHAIANKVLNAHGHKPLTLETVASFIGNGIPKLVERCFDTAQCSLEAEDFDKAVAMFLEEYARAPADHSMLYPGVVEALQELQDKGYKMGICTNKTESLANLIVKEMGLSDFFDVVVGGDRLPQKKPAPEPLMECAKEMGCAPDEYVYVGDSEIDASTAKAAHAPFILFTEGYRKILASDLYHQALYCRFSHLKHLVPHVSSQDL